MAAETFNGIEVYKTDVTGTVTSYIRESALTAKELAAVDLASTKVGYSTIAAQDETNFDGAGDNGSVADDGTGYSVADVITMSDGSTVTVDAVNAGAVTEFTITTASVATTRGENSGATLTQTSVDPAGGTGFSLTLGVDNEAYFDIEGQLATETYALTGQNSWDHFKGYVETYDSASPKNVIKADLVTADLADAVARINVVQDVINS